jgi:adenylate kinase family enzyme
MRFSIFIKISSNVLCHIAGPSGSGKTTLAKKLKHPNLVVRDLDDFDDAAVALLGWTEIPKKDFDDKMLCCLATKRQELLDEFLEEEEDLVVLVGNHREGKYIIDIPTDNRFLLDVSAEVSARRAYERSQKESPKHRRKLSELPEDIKEAKDEIKWLRSRGYTAMSESAIIKWVQEHVKL